MRVFATMSLITLLAGAAVSAQDGAALFKSSCVSCHGAKGEGRSAMKGTNLLTDDAKKKTDEQIVDMILNGGPNKSATHTFAKRGTTPEQAKALATHIRALQK